MDKDKRKATELAKLRRRAEELMRRKKTEVPRPRTEAELQRLLHELEVLRHELEMQNAELRQARDKAEAAMEKYADLYDFAPVGYFIIGRKGTICNVNLAGAALLGVGRSRLIGQRFGLFVSEENQAAFAAFIGKVFSCKEKEACEVVIAKEGKRPLHLQIVAVACASTEECRFAAIDITPRREAEERMLKSERRLAEAQAIAHIGSWEWDSITDEITGSDEFKRIFGLNLSTYDSFLELVHPDDRETVNKAVQETLARQAPYDVHYRIVRTDGITRIIHAQGVAITDGAGKTVRMIGTVQDVTERKRRESEIERLASFPRLNPNPVLELDCDGNITFCNMAAEHILQRTNRGDRVNTFIPEELSEIFQTLQENKGFPYVREIEIDGLFFMQRFHLVEQLDVIRVYGIDITERKRAEAALEKLNTELKNRTVELECSNSDLETFNYTASHDLRSHLNNIYGLSQILLELRATLPDEQIHSSILDIKTASERMEQLIASILDFSRLLKCEMARKEVSLSSVANDITALLGLASPERRVTFMIADGVLVYGDARLLRIVLENLIINAWKYTAGKEDAVIEFAITEHGGEPVYFVRDNGIGFDMADADKLFVAFRRLKREDGVAGQGIGLATVQRIISRHGGRVWAESEPGRGATFYFTLAAAGDAN